MKMNSRDFLRKLPGVSIAVVCVILFPWQTLLTKGYFSPWDAGRHYLYGVYWLKELLPLGRLSGWLPITFGGLDYYIAYPPFVGYLLGILSLVVPEKTLLVILSGVAWLGVVPAMYMCLRSFGFTRLKAMWGGFFMLFLDDLPSFGPSAIYYHGLLPSALGFILFVYLIGRFRKDILSDGQVWNRYFISGVLLAILITIHHFRALSFVMLSSVMMACECFKSKGNWKVVLPIGTVIFLFGALLSGFWWVPCLLNLNTLGIRAAFSTLSWHEFFDRINNLGVFVWVFVAFGFVQLFNRRDWPKICFFGIGLMLFAFLSTNTIPFGEKYLSPGQSQKFWIMFEWLLFFIGSYSLYFVRLSSKTRGHEWIKISALLVGMAALILPVKFSARWIQETVFINSATEQIIPLSQFLSKKNELGDFIYTENDEANAPYIYGNPHILHQQLLLNDFRIWDLSGGFPEGIQGAVKPFKMSFYFPWVQDERDYLEKRGVRFLVATSARTYNYFKTITWLQPVWTGVDVSSSIPKDIKDFPSVFEVKNFSHKFGLPEAASKEIQYIRFSAPGIYEIGFNHSVNLSSGTTVALNYHPWLRVFADGSPVISKGDNDYLLQFAQPLEKVSHLSIEYKQPAWVFISLYVSIISLFSGGLLFVFRFRRKKPNC